MTLFSWLKKSKNHIQNGFDTKGMSMIEILIVIAILAILGAMLLFGLNRQTSKARDSQRKDDLEDLRVAFEEYYNDNECYPQLDVVLDNCGGTDLQPYLKEVPCDPQDEQPYVAISMEGDWCDGYRVLTQLENVNDPSIEGIGCNATDGCNYTDPTYNYGISMGIAVNDLEYTPEPTPTVGPTSTPMPTPTLGPGHWVIAPDGTCSYYTIDYYPTAGCPGDYVSYDACFAVSGCTSNCTEDDVPLYLRCAR